jgi:serine/threonine-protein kinase
LATNNAESTTPERCEASRYLAGEVIADKYRLLQPLAEGGMGALWVAQNVALEVQVAIKLIRADVASASASDRLLQEARTAARLRHPSIIRIFDFGRTRRGDPFIVMELLNGESLGELLDSRKRLPATYAVQLLLPIAEGLAVAHRQAIIHRDLKPDNVFLASSDGRIQPKIVDFGIATFEPEQRESRLTQDGAVLGSPDYMSPEQARGQDDIDQRTDIWAFCVVLYEAVTGSVPFPEPNYNALLGAILEKEPASILAFSAGDRELWAIIERGLRKDRALRWQSIRDVGEALAVWLLERGLDEDVYGHSLRAGWLDARASDADANVPARGPSRAVSRASTPGSAQRAALVSASEPAPRSRRPLLFALAGVACLALIGLLATRQLQETHTSTQGSLQTSSLSRASGASAPKAPAGSAVIQPTTGAKREQNMERRGSPPQVPSAANDASTRAGAPSTARSVSTGAPVKKKPKPKRAYEDFGF